MSNRSQPGFDVNDFTNSSEFPADLLADHPKKDRQTLIEFWYSLTSLSDTPQRNTFLQREAVRRSRLSSSVLFFLLVVCASLLPVTYLAIGLYPSYFWLTLELFCVCAGALALLRRGYTNTAGIIVVTAAYLTITTSLFTTMPFDETTVQGYDLYILLLLLCVWLLPARSVFLFYILSVCAILGTIFFMPLTPGLQNNLETHMILILIRPIGVLFSCGGVAYIASISLTNAVKKAYKAETIAIIEHGQLQIRTDLKREIDTIVQTQVQVSNGNPSARAPLSNEGILLQVARSLNILLVRFQRTVLRAEYAERQLRSIELMVLGLITHIRQAKAERRKISLPWTNNPHLDTLISELHDITRSNRGNS